MIIYYIFSPNIKGSRLTSNKKKLTFQIWFLNIFKIMEGSIYIHIFMIWCENDLIGFAIRPLWTVVGVRSRELITWNTCNAVVIPSLAFPSWGDLKATTSRHARLAAHHANPLPPTVSIRRKKQTVFDDASHLMFYGRMERVFA